ncbi:MAG: glucose-6-phosphate isomerase, archaeal [Chloroflexi bacterium]|nr:glucose-6-phosphate isomerase, archaeal [Chloroflexota bacterium]
MMSCDSCRKQRLPFYNSFTWRDLSYRRKVRESQLDKIKPYDQPVRLQLDLVSGSFSPFTEFYERRLSQLATLFHDQAAVQHMLAADDPLLFDVRSSPFVTSLSDFTFVITRIYPGLVGDEYFMTKGHFHLLLEMPEIYFCLRGQGYLLLESAEGDFHAQWLSPGTVSHIPPGYAHRTVNIGREPLIFSAVQHLKAGHDYGKIAQRGFSRLVIQRNGKPELVENPRR